MTKTRRKRYQDEKDIKDVLDVLDGKTLCIVCKKYTDTLVSNLFKPLTYCSNCGNGPK